MNRREFVVCGVSGLSLSGCIGFHYVNATVRGNTVAIARKEFESVRFALVDVPGLPLPLYVYKDEKDRFSAVSTRCMHRGCQVEPVAGHLVCPCHGSEYTNQGEVMKGPTLLPLQRYAVVADEESVVITLSEQAS